MKKIIKKIICILITLIVLFSINTKTYAWSEVIGMARNFVATGEQSSNGGEVDKKELEDLSGYVYNLLLTAGVVIAVIVATVLGIQFMLAGAEGKAKIAETFVVFIVGCVVVFGGFGIWRLAVKIGNKVAELPGMQSSTVQIAEIENDNI